MKNPLRPSPCGCRRPPPPRDEGPCRAAPDRPPWPACGGYLMQRVFAAGTVRRRICHPLCLNGLPSQAQGPFAVTDVFVCGAPQWEEVPGCRGRGLPLRVAVPLQFQVRDDCGCFYCLTDSIEENLTLRAQCPPDHCWRGQPFVQAAARLAGRACCACGSGCCEVPLEIMIEGYILAPCVMGGSEASPCPPGRPWYPQPVFDPYHC